MLPTMPRKTGTPKTIQFSITLPKAAIENMLRLARSGYYSSSRGEIARELILERLRQLGAAAIADALRKRGKGRRG